MPKQPNHQPIHRAAKDLTEHPAEHPDHSGQSGGAGRSGVTVGELIRPAPPDCPE